MKKLMKVSSIRKASPTSDGDGVKINRIRAFDWPELSPFLMIDELKSDDQKDYVGGFPAHPHRGIETLSYMKKGHFQHQDQMGNITEIMSGDAQWMAAGRGVLHSEMPISEQGQLHSFQIWINQPAALKMTPAQYLNIRSSDIRKKVLSNTSQLNVIAGSLLVEQDEISGPLKKTGVPVVFADWMASKSSEVEIEINSDCASQIFVYNGSVDIQGVIVSSGNLAILTRDTILKMKALPDCGVLILSGTPIDEPIVHYGPFVMNTHQQIKQAVQDYKNGVFQTY